jgi:hypothetical protein
LCVFSFNNLHAQNFIAAHEIIYDFHIRFVHAPENRVAAVEMRLRRMRDEPLRAARVFARQRHSDRAALVRHHIYLAANLPARTAVAVAARVAVLHHEIRHDAVNRQTVEIIRFRQFDKIINRQRRVFGVKSIVKFPFSVVKTAFTVFAEEH